MQLFSEEILHARRKRLAVLLDSHLTAGDALLVYSGEPAQKPGGLDQTYDFIPHPEYLWLTGLRRPHGVAAYAPEVGWFDFVLHPTPEELLWENDETGPLPGRDLSELEPWLRRSQFQRIFAFGQVGAQGLELHKAFPAAFSQQPNLRLQTDLQEALNRARRPKDRAEIELIKRAAVAADAGYQFIIANSIRPGVSEREIQIAFEAATLRAGADKFPYGTIVGSGRNAAVLHAVPTQKNLAPDELVLIDAGADIADYCVDITRTFSSTGKMTSQQTALHELVGTAQKKAIAACVPGVSWREVHRTAAHVFAQGLRDLSILKCDADAALENEAIAVFFPHGVGHMVGLRVRDVGGIANQAPSRVCGVRLRVDLSLEENFVMTVEPGLYFVRALLDHPEKRSKFKNEINWSEVEKWRDIGGVRIEDDILITNSGPENLTASVGNITT